jgi:outer membrane protein assembly factor BamB
MRGLYAFVATTGELKWVFEVKYTGSPVIGGGRAILITSKGELLAVDTETGKLQWKVTIGRDFKWQAIMDDQIFVVHQSGEVRSYAMVDGALKWKSKVRSNTPLALFRELAIFSERPTDVVAIDVKTGVEKWRFKTKSMCVEPMIAGGTFFVTCRDKTLYSLEPVSGQEKWRYSSKEQLPLPTIADGKIYFLGSDGILAAVK